MDDTIIYRQWPVATIRSELDVFKERMYGGAGSDELRAGLRALDFLTRGSDMDETTALFVEAAESEAQMRIALMDAADAKRMTEAQRRQEAIKTVRAIDRSVQTVARLIESAKNSDPEEIIERVNRRIAMLAKD